MQTPAKCNFGSYIVKPKAYGLNRKAVLVARKRDYDSILVVGWASNERSIVTKAHAKPFNVDEAIKMLPLLRSILTDLVRDYQELRETAKRNRGRSDKEEAAASHETLRLHASVDACIRELAELGIELTDIETGSIGIPALIYGEMAYFHWQLGDETITSWFSAATGKRSRQPLPRRRLL